MASVSESASAAEEGMFAVVPKSDCPHLQTVTSNESLTIDASLGCGTCDHKGENWVCLKCSAVYCSRYINSHMVDHNKESGHMVALSFSDFSVWCYECDSYITSPSLNSIIKAAELSKSGESTEATANTSNVQSIVKTSGPNEDSGTNIKSVPPKSRHSTAELIQRIRAVIYGNCIGDAIGLLTEFMTKEEAIKVYAKKKVGPFHVPWKTDLEYTMKADDFHRSRFSVGDWTDDSDQMILILLMMLENKGQVIPTDFAERMVGWMQHGFKELGDAGGCGIGSTTLKVLIDKEFRTDPQKVARKVWEASGRFVAPNGAVMRTSVLGTKDFDNIPQVIDNTRNICQVTHADPRCVASCVAVTTAIALMLQGEYMDSEMNYDVNALSEKAFEYAAEYLETDEQKKELHQYMFSTLEDLHLDEDKKIGYTYKCLGAGFWTFRQNDFRKALTTLIMEGGDADTNGAVAGALLGCKLGLDKFPDSWVKGLLHKEWLDGHITKYIELLGLSC